jgi:hypothetical protein
VFEASLRKLNSKTRTEAALVKMVIQSILQFLCVFVALLLIGCETPGASSGSEIINTLSDQVPLGNSPITYQLQVISNPETRQTFATANFRNISGRSVHVVVQASRSNNWIMPLNFDYGTLTELPGTREATLAPGETTQVEPDGMVSLPYNPNIIIYARVLRYEFL